MTINLQLKIYSTFRRCKDKIFHSSLKDFDCYFQPRFTWKSHDKAKAYDCSTINTISYIMQDRQCAYNATQRHVRVITVACKAINIKCFKCHYCCIKCLVHWKALLCDLSSHLDVSELLNAAICMESFVSQSTALKCENYNSYIHFTSLFDLCVISGFLH